MVLRRMRERELRYNYLSSTAADTFSGQGVAICLHCVNNLSSDWNSKIHQKQKNNVPFITTLSASSKIVAVQLQ